MQLFEDRVEFEPNDFEYLRSFWGNSFDDNAKTAAADLTERINHRLSICLIRYNKKNMKEQIVRVFFYLWDGGDPLHWKGVSGYIRRNKIEEDLGYFRRGRPKKKKAAHYVNELTRVLSKLEENGIIEGKRPNKRITCFRISPDILGNKLPQNFFVKQLSDLNNCRERLQAVMWHLKCESADIDQWVTEWQAYISKTGKQVDVETIGILPDIKKKEL